MELTTEQIAKAAEVNAASAAYQQSGKIEKGSAYHTYRRLSGELFALCEGDHTRINAAKDAARDEVAA